MTHKKYAVLGFLAPVIFWTTYFIMVNYRASYSFLTKAISELGSMDAPNKWIWNLLGYILPGFLIAVFGIGLYKGVKTDNSNKLPLIGIVLSGIFMAVSGIFPGDFENREALTMLFHTIGSIGSYIFFLIAAFTYPKQMQKMAYWKTAITITLLLTWLTIAFGAWAFVFPKFPAVGQRLVFMFYFLWIVYMAYKLYHRPIFENEKP